jgi:hypothetical protein
MTFIRGHASMHAPAGPRLLAAIGMALLVVSCASVGGIDPHRAGDPRLEATAALAEEVKAFEQSLGIQPTKSLRYSSGGQAPLSMLWLWLQRQGTLALREAVDVRMAVGFHAHKERVPLERVYRVEGYSVYYRQGNEFADDRSAATAAFAEEGMVRKVKVILHEDFHGDQNFSLPWEIEESIVTPLASLAAVEFFRRKSDPQQLQSALAALAAERKVSEELNELANEADRLFKSETPDAARNKILEMIAAYPAYRRQFQRQIAGQNSATVLEAKLSHDLAYFRHFDAIAALAESAPALKTLIHDLQQLARDATWDTVEKHLQQLRAKYNTLPG